MASVSGFGIDYEVVVPQKIAARLSSPYPPPKMGYERIVAFSRDSFGFLQALQLQNVSGTFVVASSSVQVAHWPEVFGINLKTHAAQPNTSLPHTTSRVSP